MFKEDKVPSGVVEAAVAKENVAASKSQPVQEVKAPHFDELAQNFLVNALVPFHAELSKRNISKKHMCHENDTAIQYMASLNTLLTKQLSAKTKLGTFGKDL